MFEFIVALALKQRRALAVHSRVHGDGRTSSSTIRTVGILCNDDISMNIAGGGDRALLARADHFYGSFSYSMAAAGNHGTPFAVRKK